MRSFATRKLSSTPITLALYPPISHVLALHAAWVFDFLGIHILSRMEYVYAPDEEPLKEETHVLQCTTAGSYDGKPSDFLRAGSACGLGIDLLGIYIFNRAARFRKAANSNSLARRPCKNQCSSTTRGCFSVSHYTRMGRSFRRHRWLPAPWKLVNTIRVQINSNDFGFF